MIVVARGGKTEDSIPCSAWSAAAELNSTTSMPFFCVEVGGGSFVVQLECLWLSRVAAFRYSSSVSSSSRKEEAACEHPNTSEDEQRHESVDSDEVTALLQSLSYCFVMIYTYIHTLLSLLIKSEVTVPWSWIWISSLSRLLRD